jgi:transmembrane sensor
MSESPDWKILDRYLAGEATPAEASAVRAWVGEDARRATLIDALRSRTPDSWDTEAGWTRLAPRLGQDLAVESLPRRARSGRAVWIAAAAAMLMAGTVATWWSTSRSATAGSVAMREQSTPNGTRSTITLPDGSRITLNAGSTIRYAADFGRGARDVQLEGEGYFEVTHDPARPFRVFARDGIASDLGTRFTVRAYPELGRVEVAVAEGLVSLRRADGDSAVLAAGQLGTLGASGAPRVESNIDVDRWTGWTHGALVLNGMTLGDALPQLERWYDVDITLSDPRLANRRITARFRDETIVQVLDALSFALGTRYQRAARAITISPAE